MLQKLKNKSRLLVEKWKSIDIIPRFGCINAIIVFIIIMFILPVNTSDLFKEENYLAMEQVVSTIIEEQNTDVEFDTSKVCGYKVTHEENGYKDIYIRGQCFEEIYLTVDRNYQIKKLTPSVDLIILFFIFYIIIVTCLGCVITTILFMINRLVRRIVTFFKE